MNKWLGSSPPARASDGLESSESSMSDVTQAVGPVLVPARTNASQQSSTSSTLPLVKQWGEFQLLQRLGQGAFGEVYRAWDPTLEREVAVKLLLPSGLDEEQEYISVVSEARALARVRHPNIVQVYGVERREGRVGFWSDYIRGRTLKTLVDTEGAQAPQKVAALGATLCDALAAVHAAGLLHRDVKATNAMVDETGRVLLMDFGLSHELQRGATAIAGTPMYMAPELWSGGQSSVQSDLYALGVVLYFLGTGRHPDSARRPNGQPPQPQASSSGTQLPKPLRKVLTTAMNPNPAERYPSAARFAEALRGLGLEPAPAKPPKKPGWLSQRIKGVPLWIIILVLVFGLPRLKSFFTPATPAPVSLKLYPPVDKPDPDSDEADKNTPSDSPAAWRTMAAAAQAAQASGAGQAVTDELTHKAIALAFKAQTSTPNDPELLSTLGSLYANLHDSASALPHLRKAVTLAPKNPNVLARVGTAYEVLGRRKDAIHTLKQALDYGFSEDTLKKSALLRDLRRDPKAPEQIKDSSD